MQKDKILQQFDPNAQISFYPSSALTMSALLSGSIQVAYITTTTALAQFASGVNNITIIAPDVVGLQYQVFVSTLSPYKTMANLVGNISKVTWYSTGAGGTGAVLTDVVGAQEGFTPNFVTVSSSAVGAENVIAGTITAGIVSIPFLTAYSGLYRVLENVTVPPYLTGTVLVTTTTFATAHPNAVLAAVKANEAAYAVSLANVDNATVTELFNEFPTLSYDGAITVIHSAITSNTMSISGLQTTINDDYMYGGLAKNLTATAVINQNFITWTP